MKKKILIIIGIIFVVIIGYFSIYFIQNKTLRNSFSKEFNEDFKKNNTYFIRCNWNIFKPEFAYVSEIGGGLITFQGSEKVFYQTEKEWDNNEIGGTTVKNTTFSNLVKMVKEGCYQFQKGGEKNNIEWIYTEAESKEEKQKRIEERKKRKEELRKKLENMTEDERKEWFESRNKDLTDFGLEIIE